MKHTSVRTRHDIEKSLSDIRKHISDLTAAAGGVSLREAASGKVLLHTNLQTLFSHTFEDSATSKVYELFLRFALDAERKSPGAFVLFAKLFVNKFKKHDCYDITKKTCTSSDVTRRLDTVIGDKSIREAVKQALELSGFQGKILVEKIAGDNTVVEKCSGYTFFSKMLLTRCDSVHVSPRVLTVDGFIESVSEIHQLLQDCAESKEHVFLFCRGMSDDVLSTINANNLKDVLTLVPYVFKFDVSTLNVLNDIAIVSGTDVVSSNKGQLVSSAKLLEASIVDKVTVYGDRFIISNRSTRENVRAHVNMLKSKRETQSAIDNLFSERIRSLTDSCVNIKLPDDVAYVSNSQSIDYALRSLSKMSSHGVIISSSESDFVGELVSTVSAAIEASRAFDSVVESLGAGVISTTS